MIFPTVHLNGTSKEELARQYNAAYDALNAAYAVMKLSAPNGRDYYPQGNEALDKAMQEHWDRLRRVTTLQNEFEEIIGAIEFPENT